MSPQQQAKSQKVILVIGATGAQGLAVVDALLAPAADGSPSPYGVRALTRDPGSRRAQELKAKGVEVVQESVAKALEGVYGAWVNTDGFTVGEQKEIYAGIRIFELAKVAGTVRHYVWSNLDYSFKKGGYNPLYRCEHYDGKGRVAEWMQAQPSVVSDTSMSWSSVTTGPYMDMLRFHMFGPLNVRADGTYVFAAPVGNGHVPMIALSDLGFFARYTFDHRAETSGKDLEVASEMVSWDHLIATFTKVTGKKAVFKPVGSDEWFSYFKNADIKPVANERPDGDGSTSWKKNFTGWWAMFRDDVLKRDMAWIRSVNPNGFTLERWMRENNYTGEWERALLKNGEDQKAVLPDMEKLRTL
ncbi:NAD-P-binding protein [Dentipellis sp. KUC8613]|nr:NAD-P-binding protein [Dentipellis sp. KUC8613]